MAPMHRFRELRVPRVRDWSWEVVLGLISIKGCFICVVTRSMERLGLEDRARGFGASKARDTGKKTVAPVE